MKKLKKKKQLSRSQFPLTENQIKKIYDHAENLRDKMIILLLWKTGIRSHEVAGLRIMDINKKDLRIKIVGKYGKERYLPISKNTHFLLNTYIEHVLNPRDVFFFPSQKKENFPISRNQINLIVRKLGESAKIKNPHPDLKHINPHIFRHTFAHRLIDNDFNPREMADLMGHDSVVTTQDIYSRSTWKKLKEKMNDLIETSF